MYAVVKMLVGLNNFVQRTLSVTCRELGFCIILVSMGSSVFFYVFSSLLLINSYFCITLNILVVYLGIRVLKPFIFNGKMFSLPCDLQFQYRGKEESLSLEKRQNL